jgi:hypothetical protein
LPDGIFSYQKSQFCFIFESLGMENFGIFYGHFAIFKAIWCTYSIAIGYILWSFGIYFPILVSYTEKNPPTLYLNRKHLEYVEIDILSKTGV